jgi:dienelactone hydrolase
MWHFWPDNYVWSFQLSRALSQIPFGGGNFAECVQAAERIVLDDYDSWQREWQRLGDRALAQADEAVAGSHAVSAREAYFRAASYLRTSEFFLAPDDPRKMPTYLAGIGAFRAGQPLTDHPAEAVQIPYEESYLPGYLFSAAQTPGVQRPLVIMFGGLDSTAEELYFAAATALNARGVALLAVDGPGQGGALRLNGLQSRPDFEVAGTAALEWALQRPDIDPSRIGILGWSFGGYIAARVAAFEPRFAFCGIWGAVYDYGAQWDQRPDDHPLFRIAEHVFGGTSISEVRDRLRAFTVNGILDRIAMPTYVVHGAEDVQLPLWHAERVYAELTCPKTLRVFTADETGSAHCQLDNLSQAHRSLLDWVADQVGLQPVAPEPERETVP